MILPTTTYYYYFILHQDYENHKSLVYICLRPFFVNDQNVIDLSSLLPQKKNMKPFYKSTTQRGFCKILYSTVKYVVIIVVEDDEFIFLDLR